jgi:predicted amidohydrolase
MEVAPTAAAALKHRGLVVGIKTAHYEGPEWTPVERPIEVLLDEKLRPGDVYTHCYSGLRGELGRLQVGAPADVAVLGLASGRFGFVDSFGGRLRAERKLVCEMTLRDGKLVYDSNGWRSPTGRRCLRVTAPAATPAGTHT